MWNINRPIVALMVICVLVVSSGVASQAKADTIRSIGVEPSYSQGNYGTADSTTIWYVPFYVRYRTDALSLKLTIPYIAVQSTGALVSGGTVLSHPGPAKSGGTTATTQSGLGDIWIEARYHIHGRGKAPDLLPYVKIKLGTASRSEGLGTGENDYEAGLGFEWMVGTRIFPFADVGYRFVGQPPGTTLNNFATYDAGTVIRVNDHNDAGIMVMGHQSAVSGQSNTLDALVNWKHSLNTTESIQAYFDKGLTNSSPDYAVGLGVETRF